MNLNFPTTGTSLDKCASEGLVSPVGLRKRIELRKAYLQQEMDDLNRLLAIMEANQNLEEFQDLMFKVRV